MRAVLAEQDLGAAELAVVVVAHGGAVGTGVVDVDQVTDVDLGQHPVNGELVVVLAQAADHIVLVVAGGVLLAQHGDVVVSAVHGGAHQVGSAGIQTDVLLVDVLFVDGSCHQRTVGAGGKAAHLGEDGHIAHPCGHKDLLKLPAHALTDGHDVVLGLVGAVGDAHAAGQVDVADVGTGGLLHTDCQLEQDACQLGVIGIGDGVGGQEGMDAKVLCTLCHQLLVAVDHLLLGHAVLGIAGLVHDLEAFLALAQLEGPARVVAAEDVLGDPGHTVQEVHHGGIVQVDVCAQLVCLLHVLHGGLVGGEHDIAAGKAAGLAQHQLGQGGAVHAAALFLQDLQDDGVGQRLDGKILPEALVPAEGLVDAAGVLTDALFVVDVERGGHVLDDLLGLLFGQKRSLFHNILPSRFYSAYGFGAAVANVVYSLSLLRRQLPRRGSLTARQSLPP